ncbi:MAG: DNA adenine methylase, partial [Lachnospiraceae bacterium]|nr:DNA adenine methylase [Lachnospiraceae bacterium]
MFSVENRRYIGNKFKLMDWIKEMINSECINCSSLFDVFAGTGSVSKCLLEDYDRLIINDFLFSNEVIYRAFFEEGLYDWRKLEKMKNEYNSANIQSVRSNYMSENFGDKFFS